MISGHLTEGKMLNSCYGNLLHSKAVSDPYETGRRVEKGKGVGGKGMESGKLLLGDPGCKLTRFSGPAQNR